MILNLLHQIVRRRYRALGFRSTFLDWKGGRLHFMFRDTPGAHGSLVLVHGLGTSSSSWSKAMSLFGTGYRIAAPDLPGFGFSILKVSQRTCTLREHVDALTTLMATLPAGPVVLLGHSLGGWVCARYASIHPERVRHLVLVDTAGVYFRGVEKLQEMFTVESVGDARRLLNKLWYRYPWYFKPFAHSVFHELQRRDINSLVASIEMKDLLVEELEQLSMPVTIIWGKDDGVFSPESVNVLRKLIPNAKAYFIDRCGHVPQLERPDEFARLVNIVLERESHEVD
jgi:pimeloyl-ACP methyl ester carboxylesterase